MEEYFSTFKDAILYFSIHKDNLFTLWTEKNQLEIRVQFFELHGVDWTTNRPRFPYDRMVELCNDYDYVYVYVNRFNFMNEVLLRKAIALAEPDFTVYQNRITYAPDMPDGFNFFNADTPTDSFIEYLNRKYKGYVRFEQGTGKDYYFYKRVTLPKGA
jgi:hypothetical protein